MINKHLDFETLSDLIDNELPDDVRNNCMTHITVCKMCCREYESLTKYISILSSMNNECVIIPDFSERTLMICRSRERKRLFIKAFPAIAASVIIIAGAGFIKTGIFNNNGSYIATGLAGQNETQRIIEAISKTEGRILQITHTHIDSEFDKKTLTEIEEILHKNNIKHAVLINTGMITPSAGGNIEDVGYSYGNNAFTVQDRQNQAVIDNGKIRLRIFK